MELNPIPPRQRNRRADRQQEPSAAAPVQPSGAVQSAAPLQQPQQVYQRQAYSPLQQTAYPQAYQQAHQQPYQQAATNQAAPSGYTPRPSQLPHQMYQQMQPAAPRQPVQPSQPQYAPRPKVLNHVGTANSGWQQPTLPERTEAPQARASQSLRRETARTDKVAQRKHDQAHEQDNAKADARPASKKLPAWLTWGTTLSFLLVLALVAVYWLMQAYLVTQENERIAAYQRVLSNHHITEQADGTLSVTWQEHIEKYAAQYNLQPAFVMAIIRNESSFRTNAESNVGARGLMQLMPDTAEWIAGKLDDHSYTFDRMWDAETNIRYGCWYLGYLSRLFHGDAELVSAAYHAGQSTITQWLSDRTKSSDGISLDLEKLSDGPTKQYIGRVTQTYGIYQSLLYPDEAFGAAGAVSSDSHSSAAPGR